MRGCEECQGVSRGVRVCQGVRGAVMRGARGATHHVALAREDSALQTLQSHPLDGHRSLHVTFLVVVVFVDVARQTKVGNLHNQILADPDNNWHQC